jgi:hypothetical protein
MIDLGAIGVGAVLAIAAMGSAFGAGAAGMTAIGAWKRCFQENKPAPFLLVAFVGAPLTQTIYGFILMNAFSAAVGRVDNMLLLSAGVLGGLAMGLSALSPRFICTGWCFPHVPSTSSSSFKPNPTLYSMRRHHRCRASAVSRDT